MSIGPASDRGETGDRGQSGDVDDTGAIGSTGETGVQRRMGLRGRSLTWAQALAMFLLILLIGLVMAFTFERQQERLQVQQNSIQDNSRKIAEDRYLGCLGGVQIIGRFNAQMRALADIERRNTKDPLAKERIKAYEDGLITLPDPACRR